MKATLEFNLDDFNERNLHKMAVQSFDAFMCLYDLDAALRNEIKYQEHPEEIEEVYQKVRDLLREIVTFRNVDLDLIK